MLTCFPPLLSQVECNSPLKIPAPVAIVPKLIVLPGPNSTDWASGTKTNRTLYEEYGRVSDMSYDPCSSLRDVNATSKLSCAAVALEGSGLNVTDLTPFVKVSDISTIQNQSKCDSTALTLGNCLPGSYTVSYSVTDAQGITATAFLLVLVETRSTSFFNYTFAPSGVNASSQDEVATFADGLISNYSSAASTITPQLPFL